MKAYRLLNVKLQQNKLKWFVKDKDNNKFSVLTPLPFKDYFFCTPSEFAIIMHEYPEEEFKVTETEYVFAQYKKRNETVVKVELNSPFTKQKMRVRLEEQHNILISEADISYIDLVLKDLSLKTYIGFQSGSVFPCETPTDFPPLRIAYADFETDDRHEVTSTSNLESFAKPDVCRILCASITDETTGETEHFVHDDESILLKQIGDRFNDFDVLQFWNGREFDELFFKRWGTLGVRGFNPHNFIILDAMKIHEMLNVKEREYVSLDMAGQRYLDVRKIRHNWGFHEAFLHHRKELEEYNNRDTELMYSLEKKFGFAGIVMQTAEQIGFLPQKYIYSRYSSIVAIMNMSMDHYGDRIVWKSKSEIPIDEAFQGALVFESLAGRWKNVLAIDLISLYNTVIQTNNISPEQLVIYEDGTHDYSRFDREGLMARALRLFEVERNKYKQLRNDSHGSDYKLYDQIQAGLKIILLSIYGGLGARGSTRRKQGAKPSGAKSFYNFYCASDVTKHARDIITIAKDIVEQMGHIVVYGDTDSLYIYIGDKDFNIEEIRTLLSEIVLKINKEYKVIMDKDNVPIKRQLIQMEPQGWYSPFVLFGKKKYYFAREIYNAENDELHEEFVMYAKGIKAEKMSEPLYIRGLQKTIYQMVLEYEPKSKIDSYINENEADFYKGRYDSTLVFETKISKNINEYVNLNPHTRLAKKEIEMGRMQEKSAIFYIISHQEMGKPVASLEGSQMHRSGRKYVWEKRIAPWIKEINDIVFTSSVNLDDYFDF